MSSSRFIKSKSLLIVLELLLGLSLQQQVLAGSTEKGDRDVVQNIKAKVLAYAGAVGCEAAVDPQNIIKFRSDSNGLPKFVALLSLDIGCSGGSSSSRAIFVLLEPGGHGQYFVNAEASRPEATFNFPAHITAITVRSNVLWYTAKDFDFTKDALCCPSVEFSAPFRLASRKVPIGAEESEVSVWIPEPK